MGRAISCLIVPPSAACASDIASRTAQKAAHCAADAAMLPSVTHPSSSAADRMAVSVSVAWPRACQAEISTSTCQGERCDTGDRSPGRWRCTNVRLRSFISSNAVSPAPASASAVASRRAAAAGEGVAANATQRSAGRGDSASTAAVMMPSVPSAPMNRLRRSRPALSLRSRRSPSPDVAGWGDHLQPQAKRAGVAVAEHVDAAGVGGQNAAYGAAPLRGQAEREQEPGLLGGVLQGPARCSRPRPSGCDPRCRARADGSAEPAREPAHCRPHRGSHRRTDRCFRPGARSARHAGRTRSPRRLHPLSYRVAPPPGPGRASVCASPSGTEPSLPDRAATNPENRRAACRATRSQPLEDERRHSRR